MAKELTFEIKEHIAVLSESASGWKTELTKTKWGDGPVAYDIRPWSPDYSRCGKGKTFTEDEIKGLKEALNNLDI